MDTTIYSDGHYTHEAIYLYWHQVESILGHEHEGEPGDDDRLVVYLLANGAPSWAASAEGWTDEHGWGLIGPVCTLS